MSFLKTYQKSVALFVELCFLTSLITPPPQAFAQPSFEIGLGPKDLSLAFAPLGIPQDLASIEEVFIPNSKESGFPPLIHIQSIHAHPETQKKIYALLKFLEEKYGIASLFIEGAGEPLNPNYFRFFDENRLNVRVAEKLVEKGELTGAELFLIESEKDIPAYGIEDPSLYRENLTSFQGVMLSRPQTGRLMTETRKVLDRLETYLLQPENRKLLRASESFDAAQMELLSYVLELERRAKAILNVDLRHFESQRDWPQLIRLLLLQEIESGLDPEKIQSEKQRLVGFLRETQVDSLLVESFENLAFFPFQSGMVYDPGFRKNDLPRYLAERLVLATREKGFSFEAYPFFTRFLEAAILQSELDAERLFAEMERLFETLVRTASKKEEELTLTGLVQKERLFERLFDLELTTKDYTKIRTENETPRPLVRFLMNIESLEEKTHPVGAQRAMPLHLIPENIEPLESVYSKAVRFYELAKEREQTMAEKILGQISTAEGAPAPMRWDSKTAAKLEVSLPLAPGLPGVSEAAGFLQPPAPFGGNGAPTNTAHGTGITILITGGFHTEGLSRIFREKRVPYTVLSPRITEKVSAEAYVSMLLGEKKTAFDVQYLEPAIPSQSSAMYLSQQPTEKARDRLFSRLRSELDSIVTVVWDEKISSGDFVAQYERNRKRLPDPNRWAELTWEDDLIIPHALGEVLPDTLGKPFGIQVKTAVIERPVPVPAGKRIKKSRPVSRREETLPLPPSMKPLSVPASAEAGTAAPSGARAEVREKETITDESVSVDTGPKEEARQRAPQAPAWSAVREQTLTFLSPHSAAAQSPTSTTRIMQVINSVLNGTVTWAKNSLAKAAANAIVTKLLQISEMYFLRPLLSIIRSIAPSLSLTSKNFSVRGETLRAEVREKEARGKISGEIVSSAVRTSKRRLQSRKWSGSKESLGFPRLPSSHLLSWAARTTNPKRRIARAPGPVQRGSIEETRQKTLRLNGLRKGVSNNPSASFRQSLGDGSQTFVSNSPYGPVSLFGELPIVNNNIKYKQFPRAEVREGKLRKAMGGVFDVVTPFLVAVASAPVLFFGLAFFNSGEEKAPLKKRETAQVEIEEKQPVRLEEKIQSLVRQMTDRTKSAGVRKQAAEELGEIARRAKAEGNGEIVQAAMEGFFSAFITLGGLLDDLIHKPADSSDASYKSEIELIPLFTDPLIAVGEPEALEVFIKTLNYRGAGGSEVGMHYAVKGLRKLPGEKAREILLDWHKRHSVQWDRRNNTPVQIAQLTPSARAEVREKGAPSQTSIKLNGSQGRPIEISVQDIKGRRALIGIVAPDQTVVSAEEHLLKLSRDAYDSLPLTSSRKFLGIQHIKTRIGLFEQQIHAGDFEEGHKQLDRAIAQVEAALREELDADDQAKIESANETLTGIRSDLNRFMSPRAEVRDRVVAKKETDKLTPTQVATLSKGLKVETGRIPDSLLRQKRSETGLSAQTPPALVPAMAMATPQGLAFPSLLMQPDVFSILRRVAEGRPYYSPEYYPPELKIEDVILAISKVANGPIFDREGRANPLWSPLDLELHTNLWPVLLEVFRTAVSQGRSLEVRIGDLLKSSFSAKRDPRLAALIQKKSTEPGAHSLVMDLAPSPEELRSILAPLLLYRKMYMEIVLTPGVVITSDRIDALLREGRRFTGDERLSVLHPLDLESYRKAVTKEELGRRFYTRMKNVVPPMGVDDERQAALRFANQLVVLSVPESEAGVAKDLGPSVKAVIYNFNRTKPEYVYEIGAESLFGALLSRDILSLEQKMRSRRSENRYAVSGTDLEIFIASIREFALGLEKVSASA